MPTAVRRYPSNLSQNGSGPSRPSRPARPAAAKSTTAAKSATAPALKKKPSRPLAAGASSAGASTRSPASGPNAVPVARGTSGATAGRPALPAAPRAPQYTPLAEILAQAGYKETRIATPRRAIKPAFEGDTGLVVSHVSERVAPRSSAQVLRGIALADASGIANAAGGAGRKGAAVATGEASGSKAKAKAAPSAQKVAAPAPDEWWGNSLAALALARKTGAPAAPTGVAIIRGGVRKAKSNWELESTYARHETRRQAEALPPTAAPLRSLNPAAPAFQPRMAPAVRAVPSAPDVSAASAMPPSSGGARRADTRRADLTDATFAIDLSSIIDVTDMFDGLASDAPALSWADDEAGPVAERDAGPAVASRTDFPDDAAEFSPLPDDYERSDDDLYGDCYSELNYACSSRSDTSRSSRRTRSSGSASIDSVVVKLEPEDAAYDIPEDVGHVAVKVEHVDAADGAAFEPTPAYTSRFDFGAHGEAAGSPVFGLGMGEHGPASSTGGVLADAVAYADEMDIDSPPASAALLPEVNGGDPPAPVPDVRALRPASEEPAPAAPIEKELSMALKYAERAARLRQARSTPTLAPQTSWLSALRVAVVGPDVPSPAAASPPAPATVARPSRAGAPLRIAPPTPVRPALTAAPVICDSLSSAAEDLPPVPSPPATETTFEAALSGLRVRAKSSLKMLRQAWLGEQAAAPPVPAIPDGYRKSAATSGGAGDVDGGDTGTPVLSPRLDWDAQGEMFAGWAAYGKGEGDGAMPAEPAEPAVAVASAVAAIIDYSTSFFYKPGTPPRRVAVDAADSAAPVPAAPARTPPEPRKQRSVKSLRAALLLPVAPAPPVPRVPALPAHAIRTPPLGPRALDPPALAILSPAAFEAGRPARLLVLDDEEAREGEAGADWGAPPRRAKRGTRRKGRAGEA